MKRTSAAVAAVAAGIAGIAVPTAAHAAGATRVDPDVKITNVALDGSCTRRDTTVIMSNGNRALDVLYADFAVRAGAVPAGDGTTTWIPRAGKRCRIGLTLSHRSGWTYAVNSSAARGFAILAAGTTARHRKVHTLTGADPLTSTRTLTGPLRSMFTHDIQWDPPVFGACGEPRRWGMETIVSIDSGDTARPTMDEVGLDARDVDMAEKSHLEWRQC